MVVNALFALGGGQRELNIGDRATGKTTIAKDGSVKKPGAGGLLFWV